MRKLIDKCKKLINKVEVEDVFKDMKPIATLDDILGPAGPVRTAANSCLYFQVCMLKVCPCHLIFATETIPHIKKHLMKGGGTSELDKADS